MSFSRGEITPALYSRTDIKQREIGLMNLTNGFINQEGCVSNRSGFEYVGEVKDSTKETRLLPFSFSNNETYIIEAGEEYFRFIQNGGYIYYPDDYGEIYNNLTMERYETAYTEFVDPYSEFMFGTYVEVSIDNQLKRLFKNKIEYDEIH